MRLFKNKKHVICFADSSTFLHSDYGDSFIGNPHNYCTSLYNVLKVSIPLYASGFVNATMLILKQSAFRTSNCSFCWRNCGVSCTSSVKEWGTFLMLSLTHITVNINKKIRKVKNMQNINSISIQNVTQFYLFFETLSVKTRLTQ